MRPIIRGIDNTVLAVVVAVGVLLYVGRGRAGGPLGGAFSPALPSRFPCTIDPTTGTCVTTEQPPGTYVTTPAAAPMRLAPIATDPVFTGGGQPGMPLFLGGGRPVQFTPGIAYAF